MFFLLADSISQFSYEKVFGAAALFVLPWASSWSKINWHFTYGNQSLSRLFNATASVLATVLFTATVYKAPSKMWVTLPVWVGFIVVMGFVITYVGLLFRYKDAIQNKKQTWPIIVSLAIYIGLWGVAAVYTRQAFVFRDYWVYGGKAYVDGKPAAAEELYLVDATGAQISSIRTDPNGKWLDYRLRLSEADQTLTPKPSMLKLPSKTLTLALAEEGRLDADYYFKSE